VDPGNREGQPLRFGIIPRVDHRAKIAKLLERQ
jgi:hypothetical protein